MTEIQSLGLLEWESLGQGRAGQGRAGQGRAGQGRAGQGRAGQGRAGQGRAGCANEIWCIAVNVPANRLLYSRGLGEQLFPHMQDLDPIVPSVSFSLIS